MKINKLSLNDNYQNLNFSSKTKTVKFLKKRIPSNNITLRDKINLNKRNINTKNSNNQTDFTYDSLIRECKELDKKAALQKRVNLYLDVLKNIQKQDEINNKTCNTFLVELAKYQKGIYKKLVDRCFEDLDKAILEKASQDKIDKLAEIVDLFIKKFDHYDRPL